MLRNSRCSTMAASSSPERSSPAIGSSRSVIGRPSISPNGMPVSAMNRPEIQVMRPSASVSKIQSELASATSRKRSSLSTIATVEVRLWRSADQPKATNKMSARPSDGASAHRYSAPGRRGCQTAWPMICWRSGICSGPSNSSDAGVGRSTWERAGHSGAAPSAVLGRTGECDALESAVASEPTPVGTNFRSFMSSAVASSENQFASRLRTTTSTNGAPAGCDSGQLVSGMIAAAEPMPSPPSRIGRKAWTE